MADSRADGPGDGTDRPAGGTSGSGDDVGSVPDRPRPRFSRYGIAGLVLSLLWGFGIFSLLSLPLSLLGLYEATTREHVRGEVMAKVALGLGLAGAFIGFWWAGIGELTD